MIYRFQLTLEREEQERQELVKMLYGNEEKKSKDKKKDDDDYGSNYANNQSGTSVMKIYDCYTIIGHYRGPFRLQVVS